MDRLTANFYPAQEPTRFEGKEYSDPETGEQRMSQGGEYVGKAAITIANAFRLNDISVFHMDDGTHSLRFPDFPSIDADTNTPTRVSFIVPKSPEAYAAMVDIVEKARESDQGFAYANGDYNPTVVAHGSLANTVNSEGKVIADGRFSVELGDVCVLRGVSTRPAEYEVNGEKHRFVAVDIPNALDAEDKPSTYEKDGQTLYNKVCTPLISKWTNKEGEPKSKNYGYLFQRLVRFFNEG